MFNNINYETLKENLNKKGFNENQVNKIMEVLKELKYAKNMQVSQTLKERANNGLTCGRPAFKKPVFFKILCIYQQLGYIDVKVICNILNIAPTTFFKYARLENIQTEDLKNNMYKKASQKQIQQYLKSADKFVTKWLNRNKVHIKGNQVLDLKNDCLLSIFLKLPTFKENFEDFCYKVCRDTYYALREKYFSERKIQCASDFCFNKSVYDAYKKRNF
jgi:hypothetical protein